jgi:hypothetical protein
MFLRTALPLQWLAESRDRQVSGGALVCPLARAGKTRAPRFTDRGLSLPALQLLGQLSHFNARRRALFGALPSQIFRRTSPP